MGDPVEAAASDLAREGMTAPVPPPVDPSGGRTDRRTAALLALGSAVCALAAVLLYVVSVRTGAGQEVEEAVIRGAVQLVARSDVSFTGRISAVNVVTVGLGAATVRVRRPHWHAAGGPTRSKDSGLNSGSVQELELEA